jgi:hypothetical protein
MNAWRRLQCAFTELQEHSMSVKYLVPAVLVSLLAGSFSANAAPAADPVRARVVAEIEQARQNGTYPPSEADYVYPNWVKIANPAGVVMTDGRQDDVQPTTAKAATTAARSTPAAAPTVALMTDGHPELVASRSGKGANAAQ